MQVTSYLMMGALSPGLKRHSVTLFEGVIYAISIEDCSEPVQDMFAEHVICGQEELVTAVLRMAHDEACKPLQGAG